MITGEVHGEPTGSPNYAAPELLSSGAKKYRGAPADLYSCGIVLFTCIVGKFPFVSKSKASRDHEFLFSQMKKGRFNIPDHVSEGAATLFKRCLTVSPGMRVTIPELGHHEWFRYNLPAGLMDERAKVSDVGVLGRGQPGNTDTETSLNKRVLCI